MAWLITGGAGYIGAHVVRDMLASGREVVVLDDLSTGRADRIPDGVTLVEGEVGDRRAVRRALGESGTQITGVLHFAARKQVGESVQRPLYYWSQNVGGLQVLLEEMVEAEISQLVFSSSAAVYGQPDLSGGRSDRAMTRITEETRCEPINPYGATKLAGEWLVGATARAHRWHAMSLRYFNVAGAGSPELGDPAALNLIPMVLQARDAGRRPRVFGDDYPTPDGTCVRDYIHVADLSAAHVAAVRVVEAARVAALAPNTVRTASEKMHQAAALAEQAATRLPGGARAVEVAGQVPAAAEVAGHAAARAMERVPVAQRAVQRASQHLPEAIRGASASTGVGAQATEIVAEVASQLGSLVARVAGVEDLPRLTDHISVNIGTGRGYSVFEVIESLRRAVGEEFAVDIAERRAGDPPALVADATLAGRLLGWRAKHDLTDITESAWAAWQRRADR